MIRVLVVEDENLVAMEMSWILEEAGYSIVGPEASVETARQVLARHTVDLALLDVKLGGETVFPVSEMLDAISVPYIFVTSHPASSLPARYHGWPLVTKPYKPKALLAVIQQILGQRTGRIRRYSIEIKDANGSRVFFTMADWSDEKRRIAVAKIGRLAGMPDGNCFTASVEPQKRRGKANPR
jgi:DNA-binding response OmpR family regulator